MWQFWLPMSISCFLKMTILKYGGARLYRRLLPFFLGLILGEFTGVGIAAVGKWLSLSH